MLKEHRMRITRKIIAGIIAFTLMCVAQVATACPFCPAPGLTLAEQLETADVAVLSKWVSAVEPDFEQGDPGSVTVAVVDTLREHPDRKVKKGQKIQLNQHRAGKPGDLLLLVGVVDTVIAWNSPIGIDQASYEYLSKAPSRESDPAIRLAYFLQHLESENKLISDDAYAEFAIAPYEQVVALSEQFPREKLRKWLTDPETPVTRIGLYGLMLGLAGNEEDKKFLEEIILDDSSDIRLGIDGVIGGYLILTGEKGLEVIKESKLRTTSPDEKPIPFSETFAAMQALRFLWQYASDEVEPEKIRSAMRMLLERPELADLVINDLTRWKDWSIGERLLKLYGKGEFDVPTINRAIAGFFLVTIQSKDDKAGPTAEQVKLAEQFLAKLEKEDPRTLQHAKRLYR